MYHVLTEQEIAEKALEIISVQPGINTSELKSELEKIYVVLHPDDARILDNRKDSSFSQKVRNLNSHYKTNFFGKHTKKGPKRKGSITWFLNDIGKELILKVDSHKVDILVEDEIDILKVDKANPYNPEEMVRAENRKPKLIDVKAKKKYKKDYRITKTYLKKCKYKCEIDENHITFCSKTTGENYVEGHHLIPISAQEDFDINIDRTENILSLCPVCHKQVHLGSKDDKEKILKRLYQLKTKELGSIGITIDFYDLYNKYYA